MPIVPKRELSYGELLDQKRTKKNRITMSYPKKKAKQNHVQRSLSTNRKSK